MSERGRRGGSERDQRGDGEGGGLGIRLGDKTAGTGCLAGSRSYCALVLNKSLCGCRSQEELVSFYF